MKILPQPNIAVKPNVWCDPKQKNPEAIPYCLETILPGDLMVEFLGTREVRVVRHQLTREQLYEYEQSRFFQKNGQEGTAFER